MASYGAYTKPAYSAEGGGNAGGFMSGSQSGSQGGQGSRNYNEDSLRPVTVKQLLEIEEPYPGATEFTLDGVVVTQLTVVGQVRAVNPQPTNVTYRIDDGTGSIDVKKWVDADKSDEEAQTHFALDQHVRVFGRLKLFNQKRYIAAHFLRAVDDYNEVSYHALESTYVHLSLTRGPPGGGGDGSGANGNNQQKGEEGMFVDQDGGGASYGIGGGGGGGGGGAGRNLSANGQKIFNLLRNMPTGNEGVNVNVIKNELKLGYGPTMTAIQELVDTSVIFSTMDDETFALVE